MKRQKIRKLFLLISLLLFPVTMWYFSPAVIYVIYYGVILLLICPALIHGRRASCHYICWMAPFMVIGEKIGQALHIPQLHIEVKNKQCISCRQCNKACPMGLDVEQMVKKQENCVNTECIQCGACVDGCPRKVLGYALKKVK